MPAPPRTFEPQLAEPAGAPPDGDEWLHEVKFDGYRIGCRIGDGKARLLSRRGLDWTDRFPEVAAAAARLPVAGAFLDGEVAVLRPDGRSSFQALQDALSGGPRAGLAYCAFDLLHLDGEDLRGRPLEERKRALARIVGRARARGTGGAPVRPAGKARDTRAPGTIIRYSDHVIGHGPIFFIEAARLGLEGVVSKRRDAPYRGGRGPAWRKSKCVRRQELVIAGYTLPRGSRGGVGALVLGVRGPDGALVAAGRVGTGWNERTAAELRKRLEPLERDACPFASPPAAVRGTVPRWVNPVLVAEVAFAEWTRDGMVRHASFVGLREDKPAREVVREVARQHSRDPEIAGVRITHPDRVLYPDVGVTKIELARYYERVARWAMPHVAGRPLTLVRCPHGLAREGDCFFMKHARTWAHEALHRIRIPEKAGRAPAEFLTVNDLPGLVALVQMDVLEIHTWNSLAADVDRPDRVVFDLDPGPAVPWAEVTEAARLLRDVLASLGLASVVKSTGGKGLHVVLRFRPEMGWDDCLAFSKKLSMLVARHDPRRYTVSLPKKGRENKILIDYLRNHRGSTSVAAFSGRARPGAPVSVPLAWDEVREGAAPVPYTVRSVPLRLERLARDPWQAGRQRLGADVLRAVLAMP